MGLSRNKVAVPEGAAGTPPFWSTIIIIGISFIEYNDVVHNAQGFLYYANLTRIFTMCDVLVGGLAQLARALAWHARGHRFDPDILHLGEGTTK